MDVRYLILSLFFLVSCMPTATVTKGNLASTGTTGGTTSGTDAIPVTPLRWNYLGQIVSDITINVSNLNNAYIVGRPVELFLQTTTNSVDANYCLVSNYMIGGLKYELRTRVIPISYYDFTAKRTVRNLRVDFQDVTNSQTTCPTTRVSRVLDSMGNLVTDTSVPPLARITNDPATICASCSTMLVANSVRLFRSNPTTLDQIPLTTIAASDLHLQVDPNYDITGSAGSCSTATCVQKGFDCCLDNQCVRDGSTKPLATTQYASLLQTAEQERLQNPLAYLNYPQLYYICGTYVPPATGGTDPGNSGSSDLDQLKVDYSCVEWLKSNSSSAPFHNEVLTTSYPATTNCLTATADSSQTYYYLNVLKRLYARCGCSKTDISDMVNTCPHYEYTVTTRDSAGNPTRIDCYTPPVSTIPVPMQQTVTVSGRTAPHRFFNTSGVESDPSVGVDQEGPAFSYLDDGKLIPVQQNFSMNAVLGQMSVTLSQALPAKAVDVELDQVYLLSTTSGYYTPCPTCSKDSWLASFTAFPTTSYGVGLQATGYTTERDAFSTNSTAGNYEDTIFGRACWLPPTMIPFSHSAKTTVQSQRLNRLETQAALFVNGYQRDWFGFNKGALIGSFDGVTWFAIGKGRIVRSTSKKLYLAINAPFADVASPTTHVVSVNAYDGISLAAQYDYDPSYHQSHPYQNEAGNCQKYHMCSTDKDCITQLGWEYVCADVKDVTTNWPEFDINGNEKVGVSNNVTIDQILQQKKFMGDSTKRCVYRGAGAVCHGNIANYTANGDLNKKKLLSCAPNFYCASVTSSSGHNNKISRYAGLLTDIPVARNHLFGKDTNVLGRPFDYLGTGTISSVARTNLIDNMDAFESTMSSYTGLCQPGKKLPEATNVATMMNPFNQMMSVDASRRADYISQIGSCNSGLFNSLYRHTSCPVLGSDGNYEIFASTSFPLNFEKKATSQNACGLESLLTTASLSNTADTLVASSPFRSIEAKPLNSQIILEPTFARDACFRRAGAVCHTDLDCSPNKMHASQVDFFSNSFFGNNAERHYWEEYLVCGQGEPKPLPSDTEAFRNYDMTKNVCCREIGKDLTTYTSYVPKSNAPLAYDADTILDLINSTDLRNVPGAIPNNPERYSRLSVVEDLGVLKPVLSAYQNKVGSILQTKNGANVMTPGQWKTLTEANGETCCGGGWVRKFSDGSNDWTRRDRVQLDVSNFRCINSRTPLLSFPEDVGVAPLYSGTADVLALLGVDYNNYCMDALNNNGVCAQYSVSDTFYDVPPMPAPVGYSSGIVINTITPNYNTNTNPDFYFMPRSADGTAGVTIDYSSTTTGARRNINIRLPSYITRDFDTAYAATADDAAIGGGFQIKMITDAGVAYSCKKYDAFKSTSPSDATATIDPPIASCAGGGLACCYFSYNPTGRVLRVSANPLQYQDSAPVGPFSKKKVGLELTTPYVPGYNLANVISTIVPAPAPATSNRYKPGSSAYYLKRLGRLELSGIPQITYEMMRCSDNPNRIIPGIFSPSIKTDVQFQNPAFSFQTSTNVYLSATGSVPGVHTTNATNNFGLQHEPVFSANDFKCCAPLGTTVRDQTRCCSGFGVAISSDNTSQKTCALPNGTDLHVYFNRFVSNEGKATDGPGGGLLETDFDNQTGEPLIASSVSDKIRALGSAYCESKKVRQGGAFGWFNPEPSPSAGSANKIYNIVDSSRDIGQVSNAGTTELTGYSAFASGFRWNHHLYCND